MVFSLNEGLRPLSFSIFLFLNNNGVAHQIVQSLVFVAGSEEAANENNQAQK